jgi:hypothetical protein
MSDTHYPKGLAGRERNEDRQIRGKWGDTRAATLRKEDGYDLAQGYRSDSKVETLGEATGKSWSELIKRK